MNKKTGRFAIIEQFIADGITRMFGNPGTVEQGFLDALNDYPEMKYILTLQESIAVLMADGYARATHKPALVQLHSSPGIGNAVGALYQAKRGHAPLVVIGGDSGVRYMNMDAQMAGDLVAMMEPVTKYSTIVFDHRSLLRTLRRAIKIASTPPMGPVYVCLPQDILDMECVEEIRPTSIPSTRVLPDPELIDQAAKYLLGSKNPIIYFGDGISYSDAQDELKTIAELLGAKLYGVDTGDFNIDTTHPLYMGTTGHMFGSASLSILKEGDVNLIAGTYMVPEVFPELGEIYNENAKIIHFDLNGYEIAKNHRVDLGVVSDPKLSLSALLNVLKLKITDDFNKKAHERFINIKTEKEIKFKNILENHKKSENMVPLHMSQFAKVLAKKIPSDTVIFDEALTSSPDLTTYIPPQLSGSYFSTRGGSLGVGIPGAIGVKTANPEKTVIGFTGDGGSMYTIQALWSSARHNIGAKFVICNNGSYRLLQLNINQYWKENNIKPHIHPMCFDLSRPSIDFAALAKSMGVNAVRVEKVNQIESAINIMLSDDRPFLIDLVLEGDIRPELIGVKCGQ
ncbi:thiamine pyrophosphate-binding protein [Candidatus Desantisbacteria bacterium]|nr:thiamine pyrophosphate-binding protein [Candidatus Desantisbacteria bacterium]